MFFRQFETFDPLSEPVPGYPFFILPQIACRARKLLKSRTNEQIQYAARGIDWAIYEYFRTLKEQEVVRLRNELEKQRRWKRMPEDEEREYYSALKFFYWVGDDEFGSWVFNSDMEEELEIPNEENTSEVDALKACIDWWEDIGGDEFPDEKPHELFAVLSLWLLADATKWLHDDSVGENIEKKVDELIDLVSRKYGHRKLPFNLKLSGAGTCALKAMDAVCYTEHLQELERLKLIIH